MSSYRPPAPGPGSHGAGPSGPVEGAPPFATIGQRFLARLVDSVVLAVIWTAMLIATGAARYSIDHPGERSITRDLLAAVLTYLLYFLYEGALLARSGQTLGKKLARIRVAVLADGSAPGGRGWARAAVYALPGLATFYFVGPLFWIVNSLWCLWDRPNRQCLHDKAAKTVVVQVS